MGATFDGNIIVNVGLDSPAISTAGFGTILVLGLATFPEVVRTYASPAEAVTDAALLTASIVDAVEFAFSQSPRPSIVKVGKREANVAQITRVNITSNDAGTWVVSINGIDYSSAGGGSETLTAAALEALVDANPDVTTSFTPGNDFFDVTADDAGVAFSNSLTVPGSGVGTISDTTPNVGADTGLNAIVPVDDDWYGLITDARDMSTQTVISDWAGARLKLFMALTSDANAFLGTSTDDIAYNLQQKSAKRTAVFAYKLAATEEADAAWMAGKLSVNPNVQTTFWSYMTLNGITIDNITSTEKAAVLAKNANIYIPLKGQGATGMGTLADGTKIDLRVTADWTQARITEAITQLLLNASNRGSKIPYDDTGFTILTTAAEEVLTLGERVGHFVNGTKVIVAPMLSEVSASDRAARKYSFQCGAEPAGAIETVDPINVFISIDLSAFSA